MKPRGQRHALLFGLSGVICVSTLGCGGSQPVVSRGVFVPAQVLHIVDGANREIAHIGFTFSDATRSINLEAYDASGGTAAEFYQSGTIGGWWSESHPALFLNGQESESLIIAIKPVLQMWRSPPHFMGATGKGAQATVPFLIGTAYRSVFPPTPNPRLDEFLPTQDVHLTDKDGSTFALLGLSERSEPMIIVLDPTGRPLASWIANVAGGVTIDAFDEYGKARVDVMLGPRPEPSLVILEREDLTLYVLDSETLQETTLARSPTGSLIPWLAREMGEIRQPISLLNQRGDVLWLSGLTR